MKKKMFLAGALVALMAVGAFAQTESDFTVTKSGNAITITAYEGSATVVTIPSRIQNTPVTSIGRFAFRENTALTSVTIPTGITSIGDDAFLWCTGLTSVTFQGTIPASGIAASAFRDTGDLRDKFLAGGAGTYTRPAKGPNWTKQGAVSQTPASQYAAESDFQVEKTATEVTITKYVGKGGAVSIPPTIQGLPTYRIKDRAFENNTAITAVTIPQGMGSIGIRAFMGCTNLVSVTFLGAASPMSNAFPGDLYSKYFEDGRVAGTYTRPNGTSNTWTKK
jgi:hypothetical protein